MTLKQTPPGAVSVFVSPDIKAGTWGAAQGRFLLVSMSCVILGGADQDHGGGMELSFGNREDPEEWMRLVEQVREQLPGLETGAALEAHRDTVMELVLKRSVEAFRC